METTIIIAKVIGIYFIVSGIFLATHKKTFMLILKDLFEHKAISFIIGVILVFGGSALVLRDNTGTDGLSIFVSIVSWMILIKGILYIFIPKYLQSLAKHFSRFSFALIGLFAVLVGIYLLLL